MLRARRSERLSFSGGEIAPERAAARRRNEGRCAVRERRTRVLAVAAGTRCRLGGLPPPTLVGAKVEGVPLGFSTLGEPVAEAAALGLVAPLPRRSEAAALGLTEFEPETVGAEPGVGVVMPWDRTGEAVKHPSSTKHPNRALMASSLHP